MGARENVCQDAERTVDGKRWACTLLWIKGPYSRVNKPFREQMGPKPTPDSRHRCAGDDCRANMESLERPAKESLGMTCLLGLEKE